MANERMDEQTPTKPSAEVEQVKNEAENSPAEPEDLEKVKNDEAMDDRFQATDN